MSTSAFLSALRAAGRHHLTASTISATPATRSHLLRFSGYTQISKMLANGQPIRSGTFSVGGHDWRIKCYPNGYNKEHEGYISIFLEHWSHQKTGDTTAKIGLSILPDDYMASSKPTHNRATDHRFSPSTSLTWGWRDFIKHEDLAKEKLLNDDCLTVLCDVTTTGPGMDDYIDDLAAPDPKPRVVAVVPAAPPFDLHGQLEEAIWNKKEVDVKIEVGGKTFPAHRWMLEARSPVFKADLSLASTSTGTAQLRIEDMDAQVFKAMLRFIYTNSSPVLESAPAAERMLVAADRYELEDLKLICEETLCWHIDMGSVDSTLAFAERHRCPVLWKACMHFLSSPRNFEVFIAAGGIGRLKKVCPSALLELFVNKEMADDATGAKV